MDQTLDWLLHAKPWVEYRTRVDLLGQAKNEPAVITSRNAMLTDPMIKNLIEEVTNWPGSPLISHKSAGHAIHKLVFLADLGIRKEDPGMEVLTKKVMEHQDPDGPFEMMTNLSPHYGGTGEDIWAWALCDAPSLLYALVKFGFEQDEHVLKGIERLTALVRENGWPCAGSTQYGTFRGPGRKIDPCPYATIIMLKLLAALPDRLESEACHFGAESLLNCWEQRQTFHPYIFYMGNDFCKIKAPLVWYDILHVVTVLSQFPWLKGDVRLEEMKTILAGKADTDGRFTAESIWTAWKEWDFGQKKAPSAWLTCLTLIALK